MTFAIYLISWSRLEHNGDGTCHVLEHLESLHFNKYFIYGFPINLRSNSDYSSPVAYLKSTDRLLHLFYFYEFLCFIRNNK